MPSNRWVDRTQPQTLMSATILLYLNAALDLLLSLGGISTLVLILVAGQVAAGWGIANEKKWGYWLGLAMALLFVGFALRYFSFGSLISVIFYIALVALLLHPESRSYRRTWFR
jgi:hypothetical protein